jgi:G:T-mismatch repair DNA endonuclease (very short patch repair protein)
VLGSRKGHGVSEATRQKIRDKLKGRKISEEARRKRIGRKLSPEHRRKIGLAQKGKKHAPGRIPGMKGKKHSEETKKKLSEARKGEKNPMYGKHLSEEHRRKIGRKGKLNKNYGKHMSEEARRKLSLSLKGKKYAPGRIAGMKGKKHSEITKRKMRGKIPWNKEKKGVMPEPWNKGKKGVMPEPWNKGKKGVQVGWNKGMKGVQVGWNKGLTKETDGRVRKISESRMGIKFSEESKKKMSIARKKLHASGVPGTFKGKKHTLESRRRMSLALKGKKYAPGRIHPFKGKTFTEEHRRKIISGLKGHITTEETRKKIGAKNKLAIKLFWKNMTESQKKEWKEKFSPTWYKKGQVSTMKGKKITSLKHKRRMSASATLRFQTQKHPMEGKRHSPATRKLISKQVALNPPRVYQDTSPELYCQKMLKSIGVEFEKQKGIVNPGCRPDLYIEPKICIFVDGDYPHANPKPHFIPSRGKKILPGHSPDEIIYRRPARNIWARDKKITRGLKARGYTVLRFWQSELETEKEKCLQKILKAVK